MRRHAHRASWKPTRRQTLLASTAAVGAGVMVVAATAIATAAPSTYVDGKLLVSDPMSRVSAAGWGKAPIGGAYSAADPSAFSLGGSNGLVRIPAAGESRTTSLAGVSGGDVRASYALAFEKLPTAGAGTSSGLELRASGGSYYRANVRVAPDGTAVLQLVRVNGAAANQTVLSQQTLPFKISAKTLAFLDVQVTGTDSVSLSARAWTSNMSKPAWQATATDTSSARVTKPGAIALWNYSSSSAGASGATAITVDNLTAVGLVPSTGGVPPVTPPSSTPPSTPTTPPTTTPAPPTTPPTTTPAPPTTPADPPASGGGSASSDKPASATRISAGSAAVGSTSYPVPAGALFVATSGSDSAAGTQAQPFRTIGAAINRAASGSTIVVRGGSYHESISVPDNKKLTIQSYPKEAVWLDGSSAVSTWAKSGTTWVSNGWTAQFDSSPTYTFGAPDNTHASWQFVNPAYPMAAHPDQVWIDGVAQKQVSSAAAVKPGSFFVDYGKKQLILGSDPSGHAVRASDIAKAASIRGAGSTLRGIGIHRYAPSVAHMGAVTAENPGITIENVTITDCATTGLFVMQTGSVVRNVTLARNGMLGASMSGSDKLMVSGVLAFDNNTEHFNNSPVSGGVKISRSRGVTVTNSVFVDNLGPGLWFDESVYDGTVAHNDFVNNKGHGLITEISAKFAISDNVVSGNTGNGMKINDTSQVRIWNNTVTGNDRNINIVQDTRRASDLSIQGHDPRQHQPDPTVTWINGPVQVMNNVIANGTADCLLCVQDYSGAYSAAQMGVTAQGNVFQRSAANKPSALVIWSRGASPASVYTTLAAFAAGAGQGTAGLELTGTPALSGWTPVAAVTGKASAIGQAIPTDIAALTLLPAGAKQLGASLK